jgi:hypothetical protein
MDIKRNGPRPSTNAPESISAVRLRGAGVSGGEPGTPEWRQRHLSLAPARHGIRILGQTLIVTAGLGWVQTEADRLKKKSDPAMSSGFHLARSTGTAQRQRLR